MVLRVSMSFNYDSTLPRDVININPHYNSDDPQALVDALKSKLLATSYIVGKPFTIKAYDAKKAPPSYPLATAVNSAAAPSSNLAREVAICLSYFAVFNRPTYRGRLFLPASWFTSTSSVRPSNAVMTGALGFGDVLGKALPAGMFWTMWSPKKQSDAQVTDVWVDDEWDTVRSRGLRATTRVTAKVPSS